MMATKGVAFLAARGVGGRPGGIPAPGSGIADARRTPAQRDVSTGASPSMAPNTRPRSSPFAGGHTPSDLCLLLPDVGIAFAGDLLAVQVHPMLRGAIRKRGMTSSADWPCRTTTPSSRAMVTSARGRIFSISNGTSRLFSAWWMRCARRRPSPRHRRSGWCARPRLRRRPWRRS